MFWNKYKSFIVIILLTYLISVPAGFVTSKNLLSWYADITRPSFSPPNWVFGPVWTFLYFTMSAAVWNVWNKVKEDNQSLGIKIVSLYFFHLLVGASWSFVFFGLHQIFLGFVVIIIIISFILYLMKQYWQISKISTFIMIPYLAWTCYALVLNFSIWKLN
jgi:benzodiazapine receptor